MQENHIKVAKIFIEVSLVEKLFVKGSERTLECVDPRSYPSPYLNIFVRTMRSTNMSVTRSLSIDLCLIQGTTGARQMTGSSR